MTNFWSSVAVYNMDFSWPIRLVKKKLLMQEDFFGYENVFAECLNAKFIV